MVLDLADKARALGAAQANAMDKAERELDAEPDEERGAAVVAEWEGVDADWALMPARKIPGFKPNSATCKPPSKN
jgi:hypothetical protein